MTDRFDIHISSIPHYAKYKSASYKLAFIVFDIVQDGIPYDNGRNGLFECTDSELRHLINTANAFLDNKIKKNRRLSFVIPYIVGCREKYKYYFDITVSKNPDGCYWEFKAPSYSANMKGFRYTCKLNRKQIEEIRDSLVRQMDEFDWENCGKVEYFLMSAPSRPYEWCYSAAELNKRLNNVIVGDRIWSILVSGANYAGPLSIHNNYVNYYLGSRVYLELEKHHVDIMAHAYGLFEMRVFESAEVVKTRCYDELDDADKVLCDTGYVFNDVYSGHTVERVLVTSTDSWPWTAKGFDRSKLGDPIELPEALCLEIDSKSAVSIVGLDDDFAIELDTIEQIRKWGANGASV